jgi:hypothetical protein
MCSPQLSNAAHVQPPGHSATPSDPTSSPTLSFFSKGHSARPDSSISSITSSSLPLESTDSLGILKRVLEDVTEEPHERENDFDVTDSEVHYFCMPQSFYLGVLLCLLLIVPQLTIISPMHFVILSTVIHESQHHNQITNSIPRWLQTGFRPVHPRRSIDQATTHSLALVAD